MGLKVLITGGTSGIGLELARVFALQGHEVGVCGLRSEKISDVQKNFEHSSSRVKIYNYDLAEAKNCSLLLEAFIKDFQGLDILVNNAGYALYETFDDSSMAEVERLVAVNLMSYVRLTKFALPFLKKSRQAKLINISSISGEIVITPNSTYGGAKAFINSWSRALTYELSPFNIDVKVFCPGRVNTSFFDHPTFQNRVQRSEMKKALSPQVVAEYIYDRSMNSSSFLFFIPRFYRWILWAYDALPFLKNGAFRRMMLARINDYYNLAPLGKLNEN